MNRPVTTGTAVHVTFRARQPIGSVLNRRRSFPDMRNDPGDARRPVAKDGLPAVGAVAARDLRTFYALLEAELAEAASQLDADTAVMIVDALWGVSTDFGWITGAAGLLAAEIMDGYGDDEDGPDEERRELAARVRAWPALRAYAVAEAAIAVRGSLRAGDADTRTVLADAGLIRRRRRGRT